MFLLLILLCVVGCGVNNALDDDNKNQDNANSMVKIEDEEIKVSYATNFKSMYYLENLSQFNSSTIGNNRIIQYNNKGKTVFEIRISYYDGVTYDEIKKQVSFELTNKKTNGNLYYYGEWIFTDNSTNINYPVHQYYYIYNNAMYSIAFIINGQIEEFENYFMNNVYYK